MTLIAISAVRMPKGKIMASFFGFFVILVIFILLAAFRVLREYERGVVRCAPRKAERRGA